MYSLTTTSLEIQIDSEHEVITILNRRNNQRLLVIPDLAVFCPIINGVRANHTVQKITDELHRITIRFSSDTISDFLVCFNIKDDHLEISSQFKSSHKSELNRLQLFPQDTCINMYDLVNFRNRHHAANAWPELNCGEVFETNTYSEDWQFAPHPTMFIVRKNETNLFFGTKDLPKSFGMYIGVNDFRVTRWDLDYGPTGCGLTLGEEEDFQSPRFCLFVDENANVYDTLDRYNQILVAEGFIPDPTRKSRFAWHRDNVYCTWMDQGYISDSVIPTQLKEQSESGTLNVSGSVLNENLVYEALEIIQREGLPFGTILIDYGWQITPGTWEPNPLLFPNLRKLVDHIHRIGMKVIVWWNWAELYDDADVQMDHLMGKGKRNKHGRRMFDFSNPATRSEYLEPLFRKLFSSEHDCYDFDGIKTDFLADKIHPDMPLHDPSWRGEENYFYHVFKCFYQLMKRFKPDACHVGCSGHPYLSEFIDINRTYDVFSSNVMEHVNRGRMLRSCTAGCPVTFDFHCYLENLPAYFQLAAEENASVQIGNILGVKQDFFSKWRPADQAYYDVLKRALSEHTPKLFGKL